jgi:hypothetical protein
MSWEALEGVIASFQNAVHRSMTVSMSSHEVVFVQYAKCLLHPIKDLPSR